MHSLVAFISACISPQGNNCNINQELLFFTLPHNATCNRLNESQDNTGIEIYCRVRNNVLSNEPNKVPKQR